MTLLPAGEPQGKILMVAGLDAIAGTALIDLKSGLRDMIRQLMLECHHG